MKTELILIPCAARGHLPTALEFAKLLVSRDHNLSIKIILIKLPFDPKVAAYAESLVASFASDRIEFVDISMSPDSVPRAADMHPFVYMQQWFSSHKPRVETAIVSGAKNGYPGPGLGGFVLDMMCMSMADLAAELGVPTYVFYTSSAASLGLHFHLEMMETEKREGIDFDAKHPFPGYENPVPGRVLPSTLFNDAAPVFLGATKRIRESRGIVVNTAAEIEPYALRALISGAEEGSFPVVYPVGPVMHVPTQGDAGKEALSKITIEWLDGQPPASVLYLCFGSVGGFKVEQLREIVEAIESSGVRFLWSLWIFGANPGSLLPEGFVERTAGRGRVVGWAPQAAVLAHPAVGGFVSHCGWNSILESLCFGVPVATWPLYAEQQMNAFKMVVEMGLAVEVKMDYKFGFDEDNEAAAAAVISAEVIEAAIVKVMESESEIRKKVKEMSVKCRKAVVDHSSLDRFISDVFANLKSDL